MNPNKNPGSEFDPTNIATPAVRTNLPQAGLAQAHAASAAVVPEAPAPAVVAQAPAPAAQPAADSSLLATPEELRNRQLGANIRDVNYGGTGLSDLQLQVKAKLDKEPRIPFFIPLEGEEKKGIAYRSVTINSYRCEIKKGMMVSLPQSIFKLLTQSMQLESDALNDNPANLANADAEKKKALGMA